MGGGQSSSTSAILGMKGVLLISYYNMDLPASQSQQTIRVTEETTINNIIQHIKEKFDCQNVNLYYEEIPIDDLSFLLVYEYLDLLPKRCFGYRINQMQQQNAKVQQNLKINQQYQSQMIPTNQKQPYGEARGQDISEQKQYFKTPFNNNSNINQQKYGSLMIVPSQNQQEPIENQHINEVDNQKQDKSYLLNKLLKHIQQKYLDAKQQQAKQFQEQQLQIKNKNNQLESDNQNMKQKIEELKCKNDSMQQEYNILKQKIEEQQLQNKFFKNELERHLNKNDLVNTTIQSNLSKDSSVIMMNQSQIIEKQQKLQNKCGHYLDEERIQNMLKESLTNKTISYCDQCKPTKISGQILININPLGKAYKEFQANEELKQLIINLNSSKKTIYKCSRNNCTFFCIFNKSLYITAENSFCPLCMLRGMKISK